MKKKKLMTNKDLFSDWKSSRFIIAENSLFDKTNFEYLILLTDIKFWAENLEALQEWCLKNKSNQQGMTVEIPCEKTLVLFCLQWS
jgi:hypothetical protein